MEQVNLISYLFDIFCTGKSSVLGKFFVQINSNNDRGHIIIAHFTAVSALASSYENTLSRISANIRRKFKIEDVMKKSNIMSQYGLSNEQCNDALMFMKNNVQRLMEPSLRMAVEIAGFMLKHPQNWRKLAEVNCLWPE